MIKEGVFYVRLYALSTAFLLYLSEWCCLLIREKSGLQWHYDKKKI
jgi:hypothetical protein